MTASFIPAVVASAVAPWPARKVLAKNDELFKGANLGKTAVCLCACAMAMAAIWRNVLEVRKKSNAVALSAQRPRTFWPCVPTMRRQSSTGKLFVHSHGAECIDQIGAADNANRTALCVTDGQTVDLLFTENE